MLYVFIFKNLVLTLLSSRSVVPKNFLLPIGKNFVDDPLLSRLLSSFLLKQFVCYLRHITK